MGKTILENVRSERSTKPRVCPNRSRRDGTAYDFQQLRNRSDKPEKTDPAPRSASESLWKIRPELSFATTHFSPGLRSSLMMWLSPCNEHWSQTSSKIFFHMVTFRSFLSDRERGGLFRERTSSTLFDTARDIFPRNLTKRYLRNLKPIEPEPTRAVTTKITTNKRFHNFRRRCCPLNRNFYSSPPPLFVPSHRVHYSITVARGLKAGDDK